MLLPLQPKDQAQLLGIQPDIAVVVYGVQGCVPSSQVRAANCMFLERFQESNPKGLDRAIHQVAASHGDLHATKTACAMQVFTLLDSERLDTYAKVAPMTLGSVH
ncbi:hypothetical protein H4R34_006078 [Dimargaris verticillata]|uniref:Uncharacterized protein n=1 Tax=Dimargaris verticillata TaxID=2761393 RepID=A0A9W8AVD0_9FUNG|nr:hypothetical protein H4R34_006078 [Dimargaris verticillata]